MTNGAPSKRRLLAGRAATGLALAFLLFSGGMKFSGHPSLAESFEHLGWPLGHAAGLGVLELACTLLVALPRTALLGLVLLTGYLGGAVATHVRVGDPWLTHALFPVGLGALAWAGQLLRDPRAWRLLADRATGSRAEPGGSSR